LATDKWVKTFFAKVNIKHDSIVVAACAFNASFVPELLLKAFQCLERTK